MKHFNLNAYKDDLLFIPLGGVEQIGINLYVYHYKGRLLVVDMGLGFADDYYPGIDILVPDISFLIEHKDKIDGLVLTHAHEDHIGAIQYLWNELRLPIYATKFTSAVVKTKLAEEGIINDVKLWELPNNSKFKVGSFDLEMINLTHSIPEMHGIVIRTDKGNIFHTGDWKFDKDPLVGATSNLEALERIGKEGILAMTCDSTNIFSEGWSGSEGDLKKSLTELISGIKNSLVVVTTFASNLSRVYSIAMAAKASGRKVALAGSSLWRMYNAAIDCGYFDDVDQFIHPKSISKYKRSELLVIATGCQGEQNATTRKLARNDHPHFQLKKGDTMIFSSKIIPGNEKKIFSLFNHFCKNGIEVLTENDHFVHVSGHPNRDEVAKMYELIKPKIAIPVHGEPMHLHEHSAFALKHGAQKAIQVEGGSVVKIEQQKPGIIGKVSSGVMAIDGNFIIQSDSEILKMRRRMRDNGLIVVTYAIDSKGTLLSTPTVIAPGVFDEQDDLDLTKELAGQLEAYINDNSKNADKDLENKLRMIVRRFVLSEKNKETKTIIQKLKIQTK